MLIRDLSFDFPLALYLFVFVGPLLFLMSWLAKDRRQRLQTYASSKNSPQLIYARSPFLTWIKNGAWCLAWIGACLALMGPKGNIQYTSLASSSTQFPSSLPSEVIFLVDVSTSMAVADANGRTRLEEAQTIMDELISQLSGQNVALDAFTSELIPLVPPTLDYLFTRLMIKNLQINEGGVGETDFKAVLKSLKEKIFSESTSKLYTWIVLSDGGDNQIEPLQGTARQQAIQNLVELLPNPSDFNLQVFTIGVGSKKGGEVPGVIVQGKPVYSKLEEDLLQALANRGAGVYLEASQYTSWDLAHDLVKRIDQRAIADKLRSQSASNRQISPIKEEEITYDLYFQIPLAIAIAALCLTFILPDTRRL